MEGTISSIYADQVQAGTDLELTARNNHIIILKLRKEDKSAFPDIKSYDGKTVDVTGVVQTSSGRTEIRITSERQLSPAG